jgi:hypothetical protein
MHIISLYLVLHVCVVTFDVTCVKKTDTLFVSLYQQNQQPSSSVFLSQQTSEQYFQHNKSVKQTG